MTTLYHNLYIFLSVYGMFILSCGLVGNALFAVTIILYKTMRSTTRFWYIVLCASDTILFFLAMTRYWIMITFDYDYRSSCAFVCKFHYYMVYFLYGVSNWTLSGLSFQMLLLVRYPQIAARLKKISFAVFLLVLLFCMCNIKDLGLLWSIYNKTNLDCGDPPPQFSMISYEVSDYILSNLIPFLIMCVASLVIIYTLKQQAQKVAILNNLRVTTSRSTFSLAKMILINNIMQFGFSAPYVLLSIISKYSTAMEFLNYNSKNILTYFTLILQATSYGMQFYVFFKTVPGFRRAFMTSFKLLTSKTSCKKLCN